MTLTLDELTIATPLKAEYEAYVMLPYVIPARHYDDERMKKWNSPEKTGEVAISLRLISKLVDFSAYYLAVTPEQEAALIAAGWAQPGSHGGIEPTEFLEENWSFEAGLSKMMEAAKKHTSRETAEDLVNTLDEATLVELRTILNK
jgi:hypothetical protein